MRVRVMVNAAEVALHDFACTISIGIINIEFAQGL